MNREKKAFLADTPLQLFNAIILAGEDSKKNCDLFIIKRFKDADDIIERLTECEIFFDIYVIEEEKMHSFQFLHNIMALMFPRQYCKREYGLDIKRQYKTVYFSFTVLLFEFIIAAISPDRVVGFEDGIGSYFGDLFHDYLCRRYLFFRRLTHHSYKVQELYLRSPQHYMGKEISLCTLKNPEPEKYKAIKYIFGFKDDEIYNKNRFVYLNQPIGDFPEGHRKLEKNVVDAVSGALGNEYVVRLHPRETERDIYSSGIIDNQNNMWEILCEESITEDHVLIGSFSTAQFVPKYYYDTEPYVVFTLLLYDDLIPEESERFREMAQNLMKIYRAPEKIMIVNSLDELTDVLKKIKKDTDKR